MNSTLSPNSTSLAKDLEFYKTIAQTKEEETLFGSAAFSRGHQRLGGTDNDHRLPYKRDVDRILYSKAYVRYVDKTQVVYLVENDHITYRGLHVQLVSAFARGIAEILRLNLDLVEAISLGHDVGHPPFGHEGEGYLSDLSIAHGNGPFAHSIQSCHLFTQIEPLNLGLAVYDGFLCHDGGMTSPFLKPIFGKTWEDHRQELNIRKKNPEINIIPGTLEGCLVKLCDTMAYLTRDIEDAIHLGILKREQIPETSLGFSVREMLSALARDIIKQSYEQEYIALSEEVYKELQILRRFNFEHIYTHPKLKVESLKIQRGYRFLFELLLDEYIKEEKNSYLWKSFLYNRPEIYLSSFTPVQKVVDYLSGMTDHCFIRTLEKFILPRKIELV